MQTQPDNIEGIKINEKVFYVPKALHTLEEIEQLLAQRPQFFVRLKRIEQSRTFYILYYDDFGDFNLLQYQVTVNISE
jgi:hypothetical protein